jgi:hypothetical protein
VFGGDLPIYQGFKCIWFVFKRPRLGVQCSMLIITEPGLTVWDVGFIRNREKWRRQRSGVGC